MTQLDESRRAPVRSDDDNRLVEAAVNAAIEIVGDRRRNYFAIHNKHIRNEIDIYTFTCWLSPASHAEVEARCALSSDKQWIDIAIIVTHFDGRRLPLSSSLRGLVISGATTPHLEENGKVLCYRTRSTVFR